MKVLARCLFLTVFAIVIMFSSISFAEEQVGVKIENDVISFLGADVPSVNIKDLKFSFPPNSPEEILAIKGKIYGGKSKTGRGDDQRTIYLIPLGYDLETKKIKILYITNNYGTSTKINPEKTPLEGMYNGLLEGASLKGFVTLYILKPTGTYKEHRIRLRFYGADGDFPPVAELPIPAPAPKKEPEKATPTPVSSNGKVQSRNDIISAFSGKTVFFEKWQDNDNGVEIKVGKDGFVEVDGKKYVWTVDKNGTFCTSKKEWEEEGKRDVFYGCKTIMRLDDESFYSKSAPARSGKISIK